MKTLSLFIITILFVGSCAYGQTIDVTDYIDTAPVIKFENKSVKLSANAKAILDNIALQWLQHQEYNVLVSLCDTSSHAHPANLGRHRSIAVCNYLKEKKINREKLMFISPISLKDVSIVSVWLLPGAEKRINKVASQNAILKDSDGDGITDQFDLEPHTPANAEVDTHGRAIDTDGDSVPDYLDKEKLTPNNCFPVNKDGVGSCPEPDCCRYRPSHPPLVWKSPCCGAIDSLRIGFEQNKSTLNNTAKHLLDSVARIMIKYQSCHIYVRGVEPDADLRSMQLAWDRVYRVVEYLKWFGIPRYRIIFSYEGTIGAQNNVIISSTTDGGPYITPPPHPFYTTIKNLPLQQVIKDAEEQH